MLMHTSSNTPRHTPFPGADVAPSSRSSDTSRLPCGSDSSRRWGMSSGQCGCRCQCSLPARETRRGRPYGTSKTMRNSDGETERDIQLDLNLTLNRGPFSVATVAGRATERKQECRNVKPVVWECDHRRGWYVPMALWLTRRLSLMKGIRGGDCKAPGRGYRKTRDRKGERSEFHC
ncbi:hypothetical protein OE88DRAFT_377011 [Heliocybe sulcata]|uniref:Uncharacterized protein n=1 Tax=Heliocybe sulcata TaxID=5364 RepID=A0A5C3MW70_9AGAM|nr:hypothetical protein OE88DRAFT_377011 [Heliocybe sulcata]